MAKFDESKIITALHPEKAEVGKRYWFADSIAYLKSRVESELDSVFVLEEIVGGNYPFVAESIGSLRQFIYPYEEPPKQRMTNIQLLEWLSKGNGLCKNKKTGCYIVTLTLREDGKDNEARDEFCIRTWDSEEWIEPTVDIYERDCKSATQEDFDNVAWNGC